MKLNRRNRKQRRNGEVCLASPRCFWSSLINLISKDTNVHESLPLCVCASFPYGPKSGMWGLIVLVSDHCLSFYFSFYRASLEDYKA